MAYLGSDLVKGALRLIGVIASGEAPSANEAADGFLALQQLLSAWSADELTVFATRTAAVTVVNGTVSYAIPGTRPVKILAADTTVGGMTFPVEVAGPEAWAAMPGKSDTSPRARMLYCDYAYPTAAVVVAPIPSNTATLNLYCTVDLATLAADTSTFDMPEAYAKAIRYNLACDLAPEFGLPVDGNMAAIAQSSLALLRGLLASDKAGKSKLELPPVNG